MAKEKATSTPVVPVAAPTPDPEGFNLSKRAVLVAINVSRPRVSKVDKTLTAKSRADANITANKTVNTVKNLYGDELKAVETKISNLRDNIHYHMTLAYDTKGQRLLVGGLYQEYAKKVREAIAGINREIDAIDYAAMINRRRVALNGAFDANDYPTEAEFRGGYKVEMNVCPLPSVHQFSTIIDMTNEERRLAMADLEKQLQQTANDAMLEVWQRLHDSLQHVANTLKDGKCGKVYDSLLGNVAEIARILPALNVTGDANLSRLADRVVNELLGKHSTESLKQNESGQKDAAKKAQEIMDLMGGYMGIYQ